MLDLLVVALALGALYFAWRAIRGGFERPQSERLNAYGCVGLFVVFVIVLSVAGKLFG